VVAEARWLAALAAEPVIEMARSHTTVSVERATLRLAGLSGADPASFSASEGDGTQPWVNTVVDAVREQVGRQHGVALPVWHALGSGEYADLRELAATCATPASWPRRSGPRPGRSRAGRWSWSAARAST
jgi:beta-lysine 5,6-aminomutase alpha subunit